MQEGNVGAKKQRILLVGLVRKKRGSNRELGLGRRE